MQRFLLLFLALVFTYASALVAQSCDFKSDIISLGGDGHDAGFGRNDNNNAVATLSNGNFVIGWSTDDGIDGDQAGAYFQVFSENGTAVTSPTVPYASINAAGTGDQGISGPKVVALNDGFVIAWTSEDGPGDTGPAGDEQQDVFIRTYTNAGVAISDPIRISVAGEEDLLAYVMALSTGNFVVITGTDEDNSGNKDDYYFQVFNPSGTSLSGGLVNISGNAHDAAYQTVDRDQPIVDLGDGNFAIAWDTWDDVDGDDKGAFLRIFKSDGTAVTGIIIPYADINAAGIGDQGVPEPRLLKLANGNFVMAWVSEQGPGDVGPGGDFNDDQDVYFRIYQTNGMPVTGSTKANSDNDADEESLDGLIALEGGNFSMIYRRDEDETGNTDDYFVRTFSPTGMAMGGSIELSAGAHLNSFIRTLGNRSYAALSNGNFVLGWSPDRSADGDSTSAYFRVFDASGNPLTAIAAPYADINSGGTGPQSTNGPLIKALPNGFAIVWESADGPTDVGPGNNRDYDTYHRVYDNTGIALCGTKKTNTGSDGEEERPVFVQALANGDFVVMYRDEESEANKDDFFARVIGGAPAVNVCPTIGEITVSSTCEGQPFSITVSGLENMAQADNGEQDYGIRFFAFLSADPEGRYDDPTSGTLGTVPFTELGTDGASATLNITDANLIAYVDFNPLIIAILDATPADAGCRPSATVTRQVNFKPFVSITAPSSFCTDAGVQTGLGNVSPAGGVFSGPGITDDGNGSTYSFDPATAGVGSFELTYTFTIGESCTFTETRTFQVFAAPTATFTAPEDLDVDAGVQTGLGGGTPAQGTTTGDMGVYSGPGVTDDGNGMTYSFDPATAGVGIHTITYSYTNENGCSASASDDIEVKAVAVCPTIGEITVSSTCVGQPFSITVSGLENMAQADNGEQDYGIRFFAFLSADPEGRYDDPTFGTLGTVPFTELGTDGASATLNITDANLLSYVDANPLIIAILDMKPAATECRPSATMTRQTTFAPSVSFTAPADLDENAGVQTGLGGGTPAQGTAEGDKGIYSGPGVTDDGNGMTFSFDPAAAGVGVHTITYTYTAANGCSASASDEVEVTMVALPGNACADANDINSLFGQAIDTAQLSEIFDNSSYTIDPSDPSTGTDCFFDGRTAPIWFTFTGDGNRYRIETNTTGAPNPISAGDTQMAIYTGDCGSLAALACNEDEDEGQGLFNASLELDTEDGVEYRIMIDGVESSLGNGRGAYRVEVTQVMVVNVTNIEETPIQLFPNPTTGILHWQNVTPDEVQVFDYTGKLVLSVQQPTTNLNISALPSGFYLLKIREGKEVYSAKIVKE